MKKIDPKKVLLEHSIAKVEFYSKYLQRYIRIIGLSSWIDEINIFDVFCGTGIYENGTKGSPIAAFEAIKSFRQQFQTNPIAINLRVNDSASKKVQAVQDYIEAENRSYCSVEYTVAPAEDVFREISETIEGQKHRVRNIVFIDPYGYKDVSRDAIARLLSNNRTEVIIFLPVSHMQRFTAKAVESDEAPYLPLRRFVESFFPVNHPIRSSTLSAEAYIEAVREALTFGQYFCASFVIERDASNRYALFFITPHILGYEKILEVKWEMDEGEGRGFSKPTDNPIPSLFAREEKELAHEENFSRLETVLLNSLSGSRTNIELYKITLDAQFRPLHANEVLRRLQDAGRLGVLDLQNNGAARKGSFYLTYECYKSEKPRALFTLINK